MPQDRLRNRNAGHSVKLSLLTDLEFRVWDQYQLSADDFGLMRLSALTIQDDNEALARKPKKVVQKALERLVAVGLLLDYAHQGRRYVCDPMWQRFQKTDYPSQTLTPPPPPEVLTQCHRLTQELFRQCFGKRSVKFRKDIGTSLESSQKESGELTVSASRVARETLTLEQTLTPEGVQGKPSIAASPAPDIARRAGAFVEQYGELYSQHRHGAKWLRRKPNLEWLAACDLCRQWDDERLVKLAEIFLTSDDEWIMKTDRGFAAFCAKATWCDERLAAWEAKTQVRA